MTTRTEQEIRRGAQARSAGVPKTGIRRSAKPVPGPRPAADPARTPGADPSADASAPSRTAERAGSTRTAERSGSTRTAERSGATRTAEREGSTRTDERTTERVARTRPVRAKATRRTGTDGRRPGQRQRGPFVVLVLGLLGGGLVSLLLLNTVLNQDSIRAGNLRDEIAQLEQQKAADELAVQRETQPGAVSRRAEDLGLKPDRNTNVIPVDPADKVVAGQ
ncbi:hypothetical protein OIE66_26260 [Nonomuraea sp. NBC_01738]|uniref:hypothetical protein n=1 Tax=Nonomuraea sp. NBC_01738 TaxID=2976003 RepID=UPI002E152DE3|nr:hypothetical protein OIE66_26260 [Nonomuraea sp. NBC_01738]